MTLQLGLPGDKDTVKVTWQGRDFGAVAEIANGFVCHVNSHAALLAETETLRADVARLRILLDATQAACTEALQRNDLGRVSPWQADCEDARWQELQHPLLVAARAVLAKGVQS